MTVPSLASLLAARPAWLARGPIAMILCEDDAEIAATLGHHLKIGFRHVLALSPEPLAIPADMAGRVTNAIWNARLPAAHVGAVNALTEAVPPGTWLYYAFNAEFLFFPFCETRNVAEMLTFHTEERRSAMLSYVIDLYAPDLGRFPNAVSMDEAMFDRTGYYALGRRTRDGSNYEERQLDFYGGLRWRFEEHLPESRRRIDRIALFAARPGLRVTDDHRFSEPEYNTYACPWHHNLTAAIASFRVAKALARNPGSRAEISDFKWRSSYPFRWQSQQLMDLGLMEPGQWF